MTVSLSRPAPYPELCAAVRRATKGPLRAILAYADAGHVAAGFVGDGGSAVFDAQVGVGEGGGMG